MANKKTTWTAIAKELGISPGYLTALKKKAWWPPGERPQDLDLEAARAAIAKNVRRQHKPSAPTLGGPPPAPLPAKDLGADEAALAEVLRSEGTAPLELARASAAIAGRRLGEGLARRNLTAKDFEVLSRVLAELRQAEAAWLSLEESRGNLIARSAAAEVAAALGRRLVSTLTNLQALLATQVAIWAEDPEWLRLDARARGVAVSDWFASKARDTREALARDFDALLEEVS